MSDSALTDYIGKPVFLLAEFYFYSGVLRGVYHDYVLLEKTRVISKSSNLDEPIKNQKRLVPSERVYVRIDAIEAFSDLK